MSPDETVAALTAIETAVNELTTDPRDWGRDHLNTAVDVWDRLDILVNTLQLLRRDHGMVLARRIDDEYRAPSGVTIHRTTPKTEAWDGHRVLGDLADPMIDKESGEIVDAIALDLARRVIPACGQGATSSKWKTTELGKILDVADYRSVAWGDPIVARGPLPYQARRPRRARDVGPPADEPAVTEP